MAMSDAEFAARYTATLYSLEEALDEYDVVDYETVNDIMTITLENESVVIITRQGGSHQLWVAARSGGFHFDYDPDQGGWVCDSGGESLQDKLAAIFDEQGNLDFRWEG